MFGFEILSRIFNSYGNVTDCNQCLVRFKFNSLSVASTRVYNDLVRPPPLPHFWTNYIKGEGVVSTIVYQYLGRYINFLYFRVRQRP